MVYVTTKASRIIPFQAKLMLMIDRPAYSGLWFARSTNLSQTMDFFYPDLSSLAPLFSIHLLFALRQSFTIFQPNSSQNSFLILSICWADDCIKVVWTYLKDPMIGQYLTIDEWYYILWAVQGFSLTMRHWLRMSNEIDLSFEKDLGVILENT